MKKIKYPFTIRRLSKTEGGGWLVEFPDLPGCIADGETIEEAVTNASDALRSWLATAKEFKDPVPAPSAWMSGKWVQRVPKSLHTKLAAKAEQVEKLNGIHVPQAPAGEPRSTGNRSYLSALRLV